MHSDAWTGVLPSDCLLGIPMAACMVIPLVTACAGIDDKRRALRWILLFLGLLILDQALLYLPIQTGINATFHLHWNWFGKLFVLAWAIPFIAFGPISFRAAGFRVPSPSPHTATRAAATIAVVVIAAFIAGWLQRTGAPRSLEAILFQLTMPAIAEEIVFRGVLFGVLERAFKERDSADQRWWKSRTVWLTALAFALIHGWSVAHGAFQFNAAALAFPFGFGVIAGALRKYSRSLAYPLVLHSLVDVASAIFA